MSGSVKVTGGSTPSAAPVHVYGEDFTGRAVLGVLTTASPYLSGTVRAFINGVRLRAGSDNDYTETSPGAGTITLLGLWSTTGPTDVILIDYDKSA